MTAGRMAELAVAVVLLAAGVFFYRRRDKSDTYGSQGAVILFVIAAILAIHALGLLNYRPSASEAEMMRGGAQ
ncbi:hypothetical protein [Sphingomonas segetis]|jgi:hypothetical protein|uniref:hypothetical protein n=1 Tax=Sphingomonas segetis TaxID=1104779 RepID=UPI0012D34D1E|nr:hypothetical protein [Sphingomonas segetis]